MQTGRTKDEKDTPEIEYIEATSDDSDAVFSSPEGRRVAERHLVRLLDMRLLPVMILIFLMNYIDVSHL